VTVVHVAIDWRGLKTCVRFLTTSNRDKVAKDCRL